MAVHLLAALAVNPGRAMPSDQVAGSASTNPAVVRKLLSMLAAAGLTRSRLGQGGGALLARPPGEISLLEVYRAVEGRGGLFAMHRSPPDPDCFVGRNIQPVLRPIAERAERALEAELASVTLADVAAGILDRAREGNR